MQADRAERAEYADKRRKGGGARLVKLPGDAGYTTRDDAPEMIARRIRLEAAEKRLKRNGGK
jgi:hypothetical protein